MSATALDYVCNWRGSMSADVQTEARAELAQLREADIRTMEHCGDCGALLIVDADAPEDKMEQSMYCPVCRCAGLEQYNDVLTVERDEQREAARLSFNHRKQAEQRVTELEQERDRAIWFLSQLINERETNREGYSIPVRWQCLRDDLKQAYINEASKVVNYWWTDEESARMSRETNRAELMPCMYSPAHAPAPQADQE